MTPSPDLSPIEPKSKPLPSKNLDLANGIQYTREPTAEGDDRSSSLSEIGDRTGNEDIGSTRLAPLDGSEANDTEAETERLEDSPQRTRKHTLTSSNRVLSNGASPRVTGVSSKNNSLGSVINRAEPMSEISSLADSSEEKEKSLLPAGLSSRKRKRSNLEDRSQNGKKGGNSPGSPHIVESQAYNHPLAEGKERNVKAYTIEINQHPNANGATSPTIEIEASTTQRLSSVKLKSRNGKRKGKKLKDDIFGTLSDAAPSVEAHPEPPGNLEADCSNGEDAEIEDAGDDGEIDTAARNEEGLLKKKSAMDSLGAIEKCFATLRDKLFDEKLAQYNEELAMLNQPILKHPDYLALKKIIDNRRDDKIEYEQTLLRYKLDALQRKSIAEKAQIHSQYMQTVRDIREKTLEKLQKESYQLQRERRHAEGDVPDYSYPFPTKRSQQIVYQTSYNTEVSILSGVAKHVGFPAAPDILVAKPSEIEEDLLAMGIVTQQGSDFQNHAPIMRNSVPAAPSFPRRNPVAEEEFMELHPWANAQHPSHHHYNHLQRQPLGLPRSNTPLQTPAAQRRLNDLNVPQGSASTIAEPHSSSAAQTPVTGEPAARVVRTIQDENNGSSTPSKPMLTPANNLATNSTLQVVAAADQAKASQIGSGVRFRPLPATRIPSQRHHSILDAALKSTKATTSSGTSIVSAVPPSNPNRYPPVKAEDALLHSHQKSTLQYHHPSVAPNTPLNGQVDRIGA